MSPLLADQPLAFCQDFPTIVRRFEAWWAQDVLDRPVFIASANANPARPITRRLTLIDQPEQWFEAKLADMQQLHRVGEALPFIRADLGPVVLASLLGGDRVFAADTAWTRHHIDDDWSNVDWRFHDDNAWWQRTVKLMHLIAEDAAGRYVVCSPGLGGTGEALINLRGTTQLCLDLVQQPERVRAAVEAIFPTWQRAFRELYAIADAHQVSLIHWLGLWSAQPYLIAECDLAYMIGPRHFEDLFLPDIVRQASAVGRAVYHLDGPGATCHLDALLATPQLQAIQFSPGAGAPSALPWIPMFQKIQNSARSLQVICPANDVLALCQELQPQGLALLVDTPLSVADLDDLFEQFCAQF
jgi:5-methyltetrahydrofolate--homocysteine methyltransferase